MPLHSEQNLLEIIIRTRLILYWKIFQLILYTLSKDKTCMMMIIDLSTLMHIIKTNSVMQSYNAIVTYHVHQ